MASHTDTSVFIDMDNDWAAIYEYSLLCALWSFLPAGLLLVQIVDCFYTLCVKYNGFECHAILQAQNTKTTMVSSGRRGRKRSKPSTDYFFEIQYVTKSKNGHQFFMHEETVEVHDPAVYMKYIRGDCVNVKYLRRRCAICVDKPHRLRYCHMVADDLQQRRHCYATLCVLLYLLVVGGPFIYLFFSYAFMHGGLVCVAFTALNILAYFMLFRCVFGCPGASILQGSLLRVRSEDNSTQITEREYNSFVEKTRFRMKYTNRNIIMQTPSKPRCPNNHELKITTEVSTFQPCGKCNEPIDGYAYICRECDYYLCKLCHVDPSRTRPSVDTRIEMTVETKPGIDQAAAAVCGEPDREAKTAGEDTATRTKTEGETAFG